MFIEIGRLENLFLNSKICEIKTVDVKVKQELQKISKMIERCLKKEKYIEKLPQQNEKEYIKFFN